MYACTTKNWGFPKCVTYFKGVTICVTWGGGSKLVQNSVTYFMDGPHPMFVISSCCRATTVLAAFYLITFNLFEKYTILLHSKPCTITMEA